jgi:tripartite-type tricarboxylate transporter receptor subunit TctC
VVATRADGPIASLADVIATARQQPGKLSFNSVGFGSAQHLIGELLALSTGGKLTHVPYRGGMQPLVDVLAGQIDLIADTITVTGPAIKAGTLKGLGVSSAAPWPTLPNVPPIASELPGFEVKSWIGIAAPAGMPKEIVARLNESLQKAAGDAAFRSRLEVLGVNGESSSPEGMKRFVSGSLRAM